MRYQKLRRQFLWVQYFRQNHYIKYKTLGYERLLDRYIDMNEKDLAAVNTDLKTIIKKLDTINVQLRKLNSRVAKIEKALKITSQTTQKKN